MVPDTGSSSILFPSDAAQRPIKLTSGDANPLTVRLRRRGAVALIWLCAFCPASLKAQIVTVTPAEAPGALRNPLMGFRNDLNSHSQYPYPTVVRQYIKWNEIENHESDSVQKIRDFCNSKWANLPAANIKVIPRVYIDWNSSAGNENWPADLQAGDWTSQQFKDRVVRLIGRLGEVWDNDPRVAWVQTGIIGYWGEQENPVGVDEDGWAQRLGDAYTNAFRNKKLIVRNMNHWPGHPVGVYWDSFGHPGQTSGSWNSVRNFNNQGRYLTQVIEGEVAYDWGQTTFDPLYGGEPTITLGNNQYTDNMIDVIRELHGSALGWIASYQTDGSLGTDPAVVRANAARMQAAFGYRFHITEFACEARTEPGAKLDVRFKVRNTGSAPFYENWPLAVVLIDETTRQLVWKATIPDVDIRNWRPGHDYDSASRTYQTPALEQEIRAALPLPATIAPGQYLVGLSILEPNSRKPGVLFAVPNFFKQSQTQPLARIGIGTDAGSHQLTGVFFDDLVGDDARRYALTPEETSYNLSLQPSPLGTITASPGGGSHVKDTGVLVTATGGLGYGFSSWGGALAGTTSNPAIVVMDGDKSISANYAPVPVYRLTTASTNGAVILSPPGGSYNVGTVVTVTAVPSSGYAFGSWGGDLGGSVNSTTITMSGDMNAAANFIVAPITDPAVYRINCAGPAYTAGDGSLFEADGNYQSGGSTASYTLPISGTTDGLLYQSERFGASFGYALPLANGSYRVTLMFAENYFNASGSRVFNVALEGTQVIANLDIFSKVGKNAAYDESHIATVTDGTLNIVFNRVTNNAKISAIKVERVQRPGSFTLSTHSANGSLTLDPPGGVYEAGTVVTLTATPSDGYRFFSWSGGYTGSVNPGTITVAADTSVTANFIVKPVYPQSFSYNGNPLVRNHGAADPDVHVWDGEVWMYCSQDHAPPPGGSTYDRMDGYHAFSSTNMIDWVDHGEILHSRDVGWGTDGYMWAPGAAKANGQYYLYYPHKDKNGTWRIGVATSPVPQGPFTDIGTPMAGITGIDPAVFIDDDGQAYIYNNNSIVAKLKPNMIELAEPTRAITYGPPAVTGDTNLQFNEGSYMHKRNGVYYYSYSNFKNSTHQSFYATGNSPYGPFEWKGPMAPRPTGAQDHHSIIEFQNQWYYFYHVAVPNHPLLRDGQSRIACYEKLFYNPDGTIRMVNMTMGQVGGAASAHVNCGGPAYTTSGGLEFQADGAYQSGGSVWTSTAAIAGTDDDTLYQTDRFGSSFQYNLPLEDGTYEVTLMFAEVFFNSNGSRVFNVSMEGNPVITGLDIHSIVGKNAAHDEKRVVTVSDGQLNIAFTSTVNNAKISAIRVEPLRYPLATTASSGQIVMNPPGGSHAQGAEVILTAVPEDGYRFTGWSGDLSGATNPATLFMDGEKSVIAVFELMIPVLSARLEAADVVLSWPLGFTRWRLEWAETLGPDALWAEIPPDFYGTSDTGWFWREAATHDKRFFRLRFR